MATQQELIKERELLQGLGLKPIKIWPPRCTWYNPDGTVNGNLPCDPYSRLLYMSRGMRPDVAGVMVSPTPLPVASDASLPETLKAFMDGKDVWEGTATELLEVLDGSADYMPPDATRLSRMLNKLASQLAVRGITVEWLPRGRKRGLRLRATLGLQGAGV